MRTYTHKSRYTGHTYEAETGGSIKVERRITVPLEVNEAEGREEEPEP